MHTFTRLVTLNGSPRRTVPWATKITEYVNAHSSFEVSCWSVAFGRPLGTTAFTALVESQAELASGGAALTADDGYLDLLDEAADMLVPLEDHLRTLVYGAAGTPPAVGSIATVTTATAMIDKLEEALAWSVEIAQHIEKVTGDPLRVFTDEFGPMGGVTWIGIVPDAAAVDAAGGKIRADSTYLGKVASAARLFVPTSGATSQFVKIA